MSKKVWTEGLFTIRVAVPDVTPFLPGQFLQLAVFPEGHDGDISKLINRPYSVASPHSDELEFFIVLVEDGELTPRLWALNEGDAIQVAQRAAGSFTLKKTPEAETLWLVATGTGLAPYIAMLRHHQIWESFENIVVVHGVRHFVDLAYTEELRALEEKFPKRFKLVQSLTRDEGTGALKGRIPGLFEDGSIESATGFDCRADNSTVLLCGNPAMLDTMEEILAKRNMKRHRSKSPGQIVLERYW
ncbi:MAG: ferredoxin--NADP reductase [Mariniblastus sp.]|nr:ferredoxin--NADP reductase [Mariniblastus sp.]